MLMGLTSTPGQASGTDAGRPCQCPIFSLRRVVSKRHLRGKIFSGYFDHLAGLECRKRKRHLSLPRSNWRKQPANDINCLQSRYSFRAMGPTERSSEVLAEPAGRGRAQSQLVAIHSGGQLRGWASVMVRSNKRRFHWG